MYDACTSAGERFWDIGTKLGKLVNDINDGIDAAVYDFISGILGLAITLAKIDVALRVAVVTAPFGITPQWVKDTGKEAVEGLEGIAAILRNPGRALASLGQQVTDTVEEKGIAYALSYVTADIVIGILVDKGIGKIRGMDKADDLAKLSTKVDDVVDVADDLGDAAKVVDKIDDVADTVDDVADVTKVTDKVDDVLGSIEEGVDKLKFNNWNDMKDIYKGEITRFIKENKPKYSPDIKKWFDNGGSIEIQTINGKKIWTYTSSAGDSVPYIDGYVKFPDEYLNPTIKSIDIGEFTGDRSKDIDKILTILEEDYGITEIPDGYVVHHDIENGILQLVVENIHKEFTHIGGHSIWSNGG